MSQMFPSNKSLMSRSRIIAHRNAGTILIEPFVPENVGTNQYDVTLGPNFWRAKAKENVVDAWPEVQGHPVYNPYSERAVREMFYLGKATHHQLVMEKLGMKEPFENISLEERIIMIRPGETILAHTNEFIGGVGPNVTTMMKARSSTGRNFLEVCKCAGMGDIGYCNRWTMEITNNSLDVAIPLVVGRRIAQLVFFETDPLEPGDGDYTSSGKYQSETEIAKLVEAWTPEDMLPKQWRDREVRELQNRKRT